MKNISSKNILNIFISALFTGFIWYVVNNLNNQNTIDITCAAIVIFCLAYVCTTYNRNKSLNDDCKLSLERWNYGINDISREQAFDLWKKCEKGNEKSNGCKSTT